MNTCLCSFRACVCCFPLFSTMAKPNGPDLKLYMDKRLAVRLNASRNVVGVLRGFDQFMNIVLDEAVELLVGKEKHDIGMVVSFEPRYFVHDCTCRPLLPVACIGASGLQMCWLYWWAGNSWKFNCTDGVFGSCERSKLLYSLTECRRREAYGGVRKILRKYCAGTGVSSLGQLWA